MKVRLTKKYPAIISSHNSPDDRFYDIDAGTIIPVKDDVGLVGFFGDFSDEFARLVEAGIEVSEEADPFLYIGKNECEVVNDEDVTKEDVK